MNRFFLNLVTLIMTAAPVMALADQAGPQQPGDSSKAASLEQLSKTILKILYEIRDLIYALAGVLALVVVVVAGIYYIMGNVDFAKKAIAAGIIGLVLVAVTVIILNFVVQLTPQA